MAAPETPSEYSADVQRMLARLGLEPIPAIMATKKEPGVLQTSVQKVVTNIHGVKVPPTLVVYRYDVTIQAIREINGVEKIIDLTKKAKSDAMVTNRKNLCRSVFKNAIEQHPDDFGELNEACYDLQSTLFSRKKITIEPDGITRDVDDALVRELLLDARASIKVKPVKEAMMLDPSELTHMTSELDKVDHSLQQYLELETSQAPLMNGNEHVTYPGGKSFLLNPGQHGFTPQDAPELGAGKFLGIGCQKSIRFIEGPRGPGNKRVGVVVDTKKTPFHACQPMIDSASAIIRLRNENLAAHEIDHLKTAFTGLSAVTTHEKSARNITIHTISMDTAETKMLDIEGELVSVAQYFQNRYQIQLQFPKLNLIIESGSQQKSEFPMEVLMIADNQRVRTEHQTPELVQKMIRACAVPPAVLVPQNLRNAQAIGLYGENKSAQLETMGIEVQDKPVVVNSRVLPVPYIQYRNNTVANPDPGRAIWSQRGQYLIPCDLGKWAMYVLGTMPARQRSRFGEQELKQFLNCFQQQCIKVGIPYVAPSYLDCIPIDVDALEEQFKLCKEDGYKFMMFIHSDNDQSLHKVGKLFERKYEIITQFVKMQNAGDIVSKGKQQTMENICHKTNIKLGGVNYELRMAEDGIAKTLGNDSLCIGISLNHPGAINPTLRSTIGSAPTIVGYAANDKAQPFEFVGAFRLQKPSKEERVSILGEIVKECFQRFRNNRGHFPKKLFIFRNGCSEGQFKMVLTTELPFAVAAIRDLGSDAKITLIVPNRMHNLRFMLADAVATQRAPEQNVRPGTVIDTVVVHPTYHEFYLNPHVALQGTAKTPRFTVLYDDNNLSSDLIELLCYTLCFGHQIVRLPTSLPSPVYIATRYAERGRALLNASAIVVQEPADANMDTFETLNASLPYFHSETLRNNRINA